MKLVEKKHVYAYTVKPVTKITQGSKESGLYVHIPVVHVSMKTIFKGNNKCVVCRQVVAKGFDCIKN